MKINFGFLIITLFCINIFYIGTSTADEIYLRNGDKISGNLVTMMDKMLIIETSYAGKLTINWSEVVNIKTEGEISVRMDDDRLISGNTGDAEKGLIKLSKSGVDGAVSFSLANVESINQPTEPKVKFKARANLGLASLRGNTDKDTRHVDGEISARTTNNRYTAGGELNITESSNIKTEDNMLGYLKYDHFLSKRWFAYGNARYEKDKLKDLNLRSIYGVGSGYQFIETPIENLFVEAGINYVDEDYVAVPDDTFISGRWAVNYDKYIYDKSFQIFHFHEGFGSLEDSDDWFIKSRTGIRVPMFTSINASLQFNLDWDNDPAPGRKHTDRALMFTLGYQFE